MPVADYRPGMADSEEVRVDPSDPRVKKLVYSMYRDMLTNYSDNATDFINQKHPSQVTQDNGIQGILQTLLISQGNSESGAASPPSSNSTGSMPPPPPPPPMAPHGSVPAVRLNTEIGPRDKGPPMALAGAMMKDKKPFTYTPGGIDLSEIRSPRMAKRLQMNAAAEGVTSAPESRAAQGGTNSAPAHHISPSVYASMQPQMAIPVFPTGGFTSNQLNRSPKPSDFTDNEGSSRPSSQNQSNGAPPPPPPPQFMMHQPSKTPGNIGAARSPPPPPERGSVPMSSHHPHHNESRPGSNMSNMSALSGGEEDRMSSPVGRSSPAAGNMGTGIIYIPPISSPPTLQPSSPTTPTAPATRGGHSPVRQTKAQAASQHLGSIYIPPIENRPSVFSTTPASSFGDGTPGSINTPSSANVSSPQSAKSPPSASLSTPQLNKAPTPWMNSYNRIATKQAESPPYVNPANTPWGTMPPSSGSPQTPQGSSSVVRTIPIAIVREDSMGYSNEPQTMSMNVGRPSMGYEQKATAAQHLGRVIPIQIQRQEDTAQHHQQQRQQQQQQQNQQRHQQHQQQQQNQRWGSNLPVQVEVSRHPVGGPPPTIRRVMGPVGYNNPMGLYSNQNATDAYQGQAGELASAVNNMSIGGESPRMEPTQSKAMRLIQKVAENELKRYEEECQWNRRLELVEDDRHLMNLFKAQDDEGSSLHSTAEPRFRGGHIPSKAFKALQTTLPPSSPNAQQPSQNYPQASGGGPVTHNIQIRMSPQSPSPQQQGSRLPASEQQTPEPKKYMGSNIPSRSFKILQAMTAEDDPRSGALDSEASSPPPAANNLLNLNILNNFQPSPSSLSLSSSSDGGTMSTDLPSTPSEQPSWADPNDPYSYMSWYYWWYYVSYYWAGYDMTGYEYPEGWDPNNPYYPPEFCTDYQGQDESFAYDYDYEKGVPCNPSDLIEVPKIVIVKEDGGDNNKEGLNLNDCDSVRESDEESYWSCADESDKVIETETAPLESAFGNKPEAKSEDKEVDNEDEETEPEDSEAVEGIVEEPDTPTSEDSDATLVDESYGRNLFIEEYMSSESEMDSQHLTRKKLSTIDEVTERSRASSTLTNGNDWSEWDAVQDEAVPEGVLESEDSEDESEASEDEMSSVSVIENKSDGTRGTESKREDGTSTDSTEDDETDDELDTAVTVRLPLKLSFGKTKSYKDITTLLVMDSEVMSDELEPVEPPPVKKEVTFEVDEIEKEVIEDEEEEDGDEEPMVSYTISLSRQPSREEESSSDPPVPDIDFWGQITCSTPTETVPKVDDSIVQYRVKPIEDFWGNSDEKDKADEDICGGGGEKKSNFWDKSVKTIETRRFTNFEISEDYESDSGMRGDSRERQRVKRYTHHQKRHSVPGLPIWNRLTLTSDSKSEGKAAEKETGDLSSGWSFWDELDKKSPELKIQLPEKAQETEEIEEYTNDVEVFVEIKLPVPKPSSISELSLNSGQFSDSEHSEGGDEESEYEEEDDKSKDNQITHEVCQSEQELPSISSSLAPPTSDETSDESSSKSSSGTTTIAQSDDQAAKPIPTNVQTPGKVEEEQLETSSQNHLSEGRKKEIFDERSIKIQELNDTIKLLGEGKESERCTCHMGDRMARAESLLWRIERFLHESLSLGSEDDSGVMTDLSRQISDVDTDADNDQNDTEFLLTAAAAAKDRRNVHHNGNCKAADSSKSPEVTRRRPQSEILVETSSKFVEEIIEETTGGVKMRTTSADRKALRYQRAKTHSRLFQLLQDECGKDEDDEEEEDEGDSSEYEGPITNNTTPSAITRETITTTKTTTTMESSNMAKMTPINVDTSSEVSERRSRLLPLPLKNILLSSSCDSNSSPSGSSGVLSPTSPVTRDQLLADIISEFHLRHQDSSTAVLQNRRRFSRFPSKIFKLLQDEFGEEFYQTFECDEMPFGGEESRLLMSATLNATSTTTNHTNVQECTIHKSDSLVAMEEEAYRQQSTAITTATARDDSKQSTPDFLEVPLRRKNKNFTRDFRNPRNKTS